MNKTLNIVAGLCCLTLIFVLMKQKPITPPIQAEKVPVEKVPDVMKVGDILEVRNSEGRSLFRYQFSSGALYVTSNGNWAQIK